MTHSFQLRTIFVLNVFFLTLPAAIAQIPNAGFENWSYDIFHQNMSPDQWQANNDLIYYSTIQRTTQSHSDSFAVYGVVSNYQTFVETPVLQTGFAIALRPLVFTGYYQFYPKGPNTLLTTIHFYYRGNSIANDTLHISQSVSWSAQFYLPIHYLTNAVPDSCHILFTIANKAGWLGYPNFGSYYLLDDLAFSYVLAVPEQRETIVKYIALQQNYPNPFNPTTNIPFEISSPNFVKLSVYDILGREIASLQNGRLAAGVYTRTFDASRLASGIYFCKLQVGDATEVKKLVFQK